MSEAYERERQNNSRLDELASKVSALRGVTVDIYDNARNQEVIDTNVRLSSIPSLHPPFTAPFLPMSSTLRVFRSSCDARAISRPFS